MERSILHKIVDLVREFKITNSKDPKLLLLNPISSKDFDGYFNSDNLIFVGKQYSDTVLPMKNRFIKVYGATLKVVVDRDDLRKEPTLELY